MQYVTPYWKQKRHAICYNLFTVTSSDIFFIQIRRNDIDTKSGCDTLKYVSLKVSHQWYTLYNEKNKYNTFLISHPEM